ncbi:MAG: hypothetical protein Q7R41_17635 [Phycisphaerales bacterium]|nr:hypothetical protein [Phycisphaerales bacterium]
MKRFIALALAIGFGGVSAWASDLNVSVKSGGLNAVTVAPNAVVNFQVEGILSDDLNEGLALVGFDLHFTGGALASNAIVVPAGAIACGNPMPAFVKPDGITNPAGFGGTLIGNDLVQVGGGQNTIKNSVDNPACTPNCAPFPVGAVLTGVAQPAVCGTAVIATGSLTAPAADGSYQLQVLNLFANVIKDAETGAIFFATVAAGVGTTTNLTINVSAVPCDGIASTAPSNCSIDARQPHKPNPDTAVLQGWNSVAMTFAAGCNVSGAAPGDFTIACTPAGGCPTISDASAIDQTVTVTLSSVIPAQAWTCISHTGTGDQVCLGSLPADANGDRTAAPVDILDIIDNLNGVLIPPLAVHQCDMDRSNLCAPADILTEIDLLNGASGFLVWNGKTLPACPSAP